MGAHIEYVGSNHWRMTGRRRVADIRQIDVPDARGNVKARWDVKMSDAEPETVWSTLGVALGYAYSKCGEEELHLES